MDRLRKFIPAQIVDKFSAKDEKSKVVLRNAFFSFFIKGVNIAVNFLTIPLVLSFLNTTQYGIWLTLTAVLSWFALFDLGFGNGLRNRLTAAVALKKYDEARVYVSTTYAALSVIFGLLLIIFLVANQFINWPKVFNAPLNIKGDLDGAVLYAISLLFVQFVLRLINTVMLSFQRSALADLTNTLVQVFILIGLYFLKVLHLNSLTCVAAIYASVPVLVFLITSIVLYTKKYRSIRPSVTHIKVTHIKSLLNLGLSFFIIQIAALVLYASDNFIIAQFFTPANVTTYNIAFKYFSVTNIIFTIALVPFWSMTTKALAENDWSWIKTALKRLLMIWCALIVIELIQFAFANPLYDIWTQGKVVVPTSLSLIMLLYFITMNCGVIFANFLNGVGKVKIQLLTAIVSMVLNIPIAIVLIKVFHFGIIGIPIATITTMIGSITFSILQTNKLLANSATGIWNK
ncbi:oligosaccharide flippase family protein [Mucilaginibacter boryungensis]|uniref:Oligosaccharide flippase family protein n=1 Tax=Mucilaginibacter boryungensis TaxID=768480 RepID=A0ABR9XKI1_9SPHI|nr:oligosaccharide flippase family protein [Mucilaginibacter boryungensis]MBE9667898.1 oligosaccharide flippase family protein [Mucilaginibacter boryungensis]